jgi:hypothetical protein
MNTFTGVGNIEAALAIAGASWTIELNPGTFTEDLVAGDWGATGTEAKMKIVTTGSAADTIIMFAGGDDVIDVAELSMDNVTIVGPLAITGNKVTLTNCTFKKSGSATTTAAETLLTYSDPHATVPKGTITDCTFDTTLGAVQDTALNITQDGLTVSGCTFSVDATTAGLQDWAITSTAAAASATYATKITDCTISGASGTGIMVNSATGNTQITGSTLSGLNQAIDVADGAVTVKDSTITDNGKAPIPPGLPGTGTPAIDIGPGAATAVTMNNTEISNSADAAINVQAGIVSVNAMFNTITGNAVNIKTAFVGTVNATHNWWGVGTGPAAGSILGTVPGTIIVNTAGYLGVAGSGTQALGAATLIGKTTAGVDVSIVTAAGVASAPAIIGVGRYSDNPQETTPFPAVENGFFDVYVGAPVNLTDVATIKLYGAVTPQTRAYVWSDLQGKWVLCTTQSANTFGGYVWVKTGATIIPTISDLGGTPFVLVETPVAPVTVMLTAPQAGSTDMLATNVPFTWVGVPGATSYMVTLSAKADLSSPIAEATASGTAFTYTGTLDYSTPYYWKVVAMNGGVTIGISDVTTFIIMSEPAPVEPPAPPDVNVDIEAPPAPDVTVEAPPVPEVTVEYTPPTETPATPSYIWAIIVIGAVLAIAVIVLIVRTRRPV